jgi:cation diffusion facilitator CzcD-associated flavoprotein CzcO
MPADHVDVLIIGAGLSGIGAACHLRRRCPGKTFAIIEAREAIGGTWDLFRYPGVRSDSDMFTLGYSFQPWTEAKAIADGPSILEYIRRTARQTGVDKKIRFGLRVVAAEWDSASARWTVDCQPADGTDLVRLTCGFLFSCTGYYRYDEGYAPRFAGQDRFGGQIVHPQLWPADLDYAGKRVVVIGSGATAVTLVPAMAETAEHVTMLQRSPTYVLAMPSRDPIADVLRKRLPARAAYPLVRWKNALLATLIYRLSQRRPAFMRKLLRRGLEKQLPPGYDIDRHFTPRYDPWDQRLCLAPDGDLFTAIRRGRASMVTDQIESFTEDGITLASGEHLPADIVVTATGLNLLPMGGLSLTVDGSPVALPETVAYKGMMLGGIPNYAFTVGYTNASWTLKADLVDEYVCRLLRHMDQHGHQIAIPQPPPEGAATRPLIDLNAGYVLRSIDVLPKQGPSAPWRLYQNYPRDVRLMRHGPVEDAMRFSRANARAGAAAPV